MTVQSFDDVFVVILFVAKLLVVDNFCFFLLRSLVKCNDDEKLCEEKLTKLRKSKVCTKLRKPQKVIRNITTIHSHN